MYRHDYTGWGSVLSALLMIHALLKFIQSNVYLKTNVCYYLGPLQQRYSLQRHPSDIVQQDWLSDELGS